MVLEEMPVVLGIYNTTWGWIPPDMARTAGGLRASFDSIESGRQETLHRLAAEIWG